MFCLVIGLITLGCGIGYLLMGYEILVGLVQVFLGLLCVALVFIWRHAEKEKKNDQLSQ